MDLFAEKQQEIDRRASEAIAAYPSFWTRMIQDWCQPGQEYRAWLMYSASYLFRTANVRWAIDPVRLKHRLPGAPEMPAGDLKGLDFLLLTHEHGDHLDLDLLRQLQDEPILWVIPAPLWRLVKAELHIPRSRLIVPQVLKPTEIHGICITPFDGFHWEKQSGTERLRGVPSLGYLVECNGKRWLFPGDTRTYDVGKLPSVGPVDCIFAHLWLGRGAALLEAPPLLDEFCRFFVDLQPGRVILTHLHEFGRDAHDVWNPGHGEKVLSWFQKNAPEIKCNFSCLGECLTL